LFDGTLLKVWRKEEHLSQDEAGRRANITQAYWNALETGKRVPSIEVLSVISNITGIRKSTLLKETDLLPNSPLFPTPDEQVPSLESGEKTRAEIGGVIEAGLRAWKESREAVEAMRPEILADGVSYEEAVVIDTEASEAIRSLEVLRERLKGILRVA
jgi:transcriptional regulator with XRE-family HTH domain